MQNTLISRRGLIAGAATLGTGLTLGAGIAGLGIAGSGRAQAAAPITLRVSSSAPPDRFGAHYLWFKPFQEELAKRVGDQIKLEYFPNGQLGREADVVNQVKGGSVDMILTGASIWATIVPEFGLLDLGFLFNSYDHCARALDTGVGAAYDAMLQERAGVTILGWGFQVGARSIYTNKEVTTLPQLKGNKLRVLPTKAFIDTFNIIGATPTPMPINEVYTALQTGVVDGFEHDPGTVLSYKWYEVSRHCLQTRHIYTPLLAYIGKRGLAKIPAALIPQFQQAAAAATAACRAEVPKVEEEAMTQLREKGLTFLEVKPDELQDLKRRMSEELYTAYLKQYPATAPLFEKIKASA